jgi:hypothetical protein
VQEKEQENAGEDRIALRNVSPGREPQKDFILKQVSSTFVAFWGPVCCQHSEPMGPHLDGGRSSGS